MNVAVLTLTRDRLAYTRHCFGTLRDNAGIPYDHFVLDNASTDGTAEWLLADQTLDVTVASENIGICRGLNLLLDEAVTPAGYDAIVRFDNDCEVVQPDTLKILCELAVSHKAILAPHVNGLRNPPPIIRTHELSGYGVSEPHHMGGIFMVIPALVFSTRGFRYDERQPLWGGDELVCPWWRDHCGRTGYVDGLEVNHYLGTDGQETDDPAYWSRKTTEMAA